MNWFRKHRRRFVWLALFISFVSATAPACARAFDVMQTRGPTWVAMCSTGGLKRVALPEAPPTAPSKPDMSSQCPFCALQGQAPVPPEPVASPALIRIALFGANTLSPPATSAPSHINPANRTRAPPPLLLMP